MMAHSSTPCSIPGRRQFAESIVADVAHRHKLIPRDLTGPDRFAHFVAARREAARVLWHLGIYAKEIGNALGGRHHTTILHYVETEGWES